MCTPFQPFSRSAVVAEASMAKSARSKATMAKSAGVVSLKNRVRQRRIP